MIRLSSVKAESMSPRKALPLPRFINPANVDIGDVVRVSWEAGGILHTRTARVYRKVDEGGYQMLYNEEGYEIMHWSAATDKKVRVTLIAKAEAQHSMLEGIEL